MHSYACLRSVITATADSGARFPWCSPSQCIRASVPSLMCVHSNHPCPCLSCSGGVSRELSMGEELASGFAAGFLSGAVCSPLELIMIQQQRKGGSFLGTAGGVMRGGLASVYRGFFTCANREGEWREGVEGGSGGRGGLGREETHACCLGLRLVVY